MKNKNQLLFLPILLCLGLMTQLSRAETSSAISEHTKSGTDSVQIQQRLKNFSPESLAVINREIDFNHFAGVIPANVVEELIETESVADVMLNFLPLASYYALPVISNFYVGAVAQGESGALYLGANLEVAGVGLNNSIHAEQSAINSALLHNEKGLIRIAITAAPCGHCRQFMNEIKNGSGIEIIVLENDPTHLEDLLPESFGPANLGSTTPLFVVDKSRSTTNQKICDVIGQHHEQKHPLICTASYAPHTNSLSSVLLKVSEEIYTVGVYIENAAYNPSLSPFLSALDRLRFRERDFSKIREAVLVEVEDANVGQEIHTSSLISLLAPKAEIKVVTVTQK